LDPPRRAKKGLKRPQRSLRENGGPKGVSGREKGGKTPKKGCTRGGKKDTVEKRGKTWVEPHVSTKKKGLKEKGFTMGKAPTVRVKPKRP